MNNEIFKKSKHLCIDCQNGYAHKCPKIRNGTPVEGWETEHTEYFEHRNDKDGKNVKVLTSALLVKSCPKFIPDEPSPQKVAPPKFDGWNAFCEITKELKRL